MQIGIFAKTFAGRDAETVLRAAAEAGFDGVQYNLHCSGLDPMPEVLPKAMAAEIALAARAIRQQIFAVSGTYNMIHPDQNIRDAGHRRLGTLAAGCGPMGTRLITLCTGTRDPDDQWRSHPDNDTPEAWHDLIRSMEAAVQIAETNDICLGIEPELANVVNSAQAARRLIDEMKSDRIKIVLDPANLFETATLAAQRRIVSEAVDLLAEHLAMGHAKDRAASGAFATAGKGVIDFDHYLGALHNAGFAGPIVAHGLAAGEAGTVATFLRQKMEASAK